MDICKSGIVIRLFEDNGDEFVVRYLRKAVSITCIALLISSTVLSSEILGEGDRKVKGEAVYVDNSRYKVATGEASDTPEEEKQQVVKSGQTTEVPWQNNDAFQKALEQNNTPVLLGAYRTVLRDPLPGEEENVHLAARMLAGIVVNPGQVFSQNQKIGPYTQERGFQKGPTYVGSTLTTTIGGGVCKIASTLYNVTVLSNLQIVERQNHGMPVPYVPYGQDATVAYGARDFKFKNDTDAPVLIWAQGVDNILYIGFYGRTQPPRIEWKHEITDIVKSPIVYKSNPQLERGTEKVVLEGMDGAFVKSWIILTKEDGTTITKPMPSSSYRPMPTLVEKGP